jgi:hypothetical protein
MFKCGGGDDETLLKIGIFMQVTRFCNHYIKVAVAGNGIAIWYVEAVEAIKRFDSTEIMAVIDRRIELVGHQEGCPSFNL